nr:unnamed protein product [Spirometra erinaceieuropaei]
MSQSRSATRSGPKRRLCCASEYYLHKLSWKAPRGEVKQFSGYIVYVSGKASRETRDTEATFSDLAPSTQYFFRIHTVRYGYIFIQPGVFVHARTFDEADRNPSEATATALSSTSIRLSWNAPKNAAYLRVKYEISWKPGDGPSLKTESREIIISQLAPNTTYEFQVHSMDAFETALMPGVSATATTMAKDLEGWPFWLNASSITLVILTPIILVVVYFVFSYKNPSWSLLSNEKPRINTEEQPVFG